MCSNAHASDWMTGSEGSKGPPFVPIPNRWAVLGNGNVSPTKESEVIHPSLLSASSSLISVKTFGLKNMLIC